MNRKLLAIALAFISSTATITGCDNTDLKIDNDEISVKQLESIIGEKLKEDIDEEKDVYAVDLDGDGKKEYLVKYRTVGNDSPLRIMILAEEDGVPVKKDEIKNVGEDFDNLEYIDINDNGKLEIVAGFKVGDNLSKGISIYEYRDGKAVEIFEEYYSKYILQNIDNDSKKEVVIIKEKEKEEKSYAYLYRWQGDNFENTKKVEIDPTLDSEAQIFKKLLEE